LRNIADSLSGTIIRGFDDFDHLTSENTAQGTISYQYDAGGRRIGMTVAGQPATSYGYDEADRITQVTTATSPLLFGYDAANRRTSLTLPGGVAISYRYDPASQITDLEYENASGLIGNLQYSYDQVGHVAQLAGSYAATGLPTATTSAIYDAANRLSNWNGRQRSFDVNGNLSSDGNNSYTWNARNQLASISGAMGTASFQYDAFGRRTNKYVNGIATSYLYDNFNIVQELSGSTATANLVSGGIDELFTRKDTGIWSVLPDALGSTLALADAGGTPATRYTYEPFGAVTVSGPTNTNSYQYAGRENDGNGLYYYRARYYESGTGRFLSEDPLQYGGGLNFYAYALNNPISFTDPFGLDVNICLYPHAANNLGHVGFGIVGTDPYTYGFYPLYNSDARWYRQQNRMHGPGRVKPDISEGEQTCIRVPTTPNQDRCMLRCRWRRYDNPGTYDLMSRQCTSFVRDCMHECGLRAGEYNGPYPTDFYRSVTNANSGH
jgi:RHS repeat-associated protein